MLKMVEKSQAQVRSNLERIIANVDKSRSALEWCRDRGLAAYAVDVETSNPKILVETSGRCNALVAEGLAAEIGSQMVGGIHSRVMCVPVFGCQVMWVERGN